MKKLLEHKGYKGTVDFDAEEGTLFGKVLCIESMLMYHGESVQEITNAFVNVVDDYLTHCAKNAVSPNKPMAGHTERHGK